MFTHTSVVTPHTISLSMPRLLQHRCRSVAKNAPLPGLSITGSPATRVELGDDVVSGFAADQDAAHRTRRADAQLGAPRSTLARRHVGQIGTVALARVHDSMPEPRAAPSSSARHGLDRRGELRDVVAEHFAEAARLQEVALHVDDHERGRVEIDFDRFRLRVQYDFHRPPPIVMTSHENQANGMPCRPAEKGFSEVMSCNLRIHRTLRRPSRDLVARPGRRNRCYSRSQTSAVPGGKLMTCSFNGKVFAIAIGAALAATSPLSAQSQNWDAVIAAAKQEGKLLIYNGTNFPVVRKIANEMQKTYGITVDVLDGRATEIRERIRIEQSTNRTVASLSYSGYTTLFTQSQEGAFKDPGALPNAKGVAPDLAPKNGLSLAASGCYPDVQYQPGERR